MMLPGVVDGHTIRTDPHVDPGAAVNMFPEFGRREARDSARPARFMLPTHGFDRFHRQSSGPVTALEGTREVSERLVAVTGRTIHFYTNNRETATQVGGFPVRIRPVLGAAQADSNYYWVTESGKIKGTGGLILEVPGVRLLGLACVLNNVTDPDSATDAEYLMATCFEDRIVRVWKNDSGWSRETGMDLDLGEDTAMNVPESMWMDRDGRRLLVLDAIGGRIVEYEFNVSPEDGDPHWKRLTPNGDANPFNVQRAFGEKGVPVQVAGIYADDAVIRVAIKRGTAWLQAIFDRDNGLPFSLGPSVSTALGTYQPCGAVNGIAGRTWFVNGEQIEGNNNGKFFTATGDSQQNLVDEVSTRHDPEPLVPMGDVGRYMGVVVDRRLHLLDLQEDRLLLNVEGGIDGLDYSTGRLAGVNAVEGRVKVSAIDQVHTGRQRHGDVVADAAFSVPSSTAVNGELTPHVVVGVRDILALHSNNRLYSYRRYEIEEDAVPLADEASTVPFVRAVCVSKAQTLVIEDRGTVNEDVIVKRWNKQPTDMASAVSPVPAPLSPPEGYTTPNGLTNNITLNFDRQNIVSAASDGTRLFILHRTNTQSIRQLTVYNLASHGTDLGAPVAALSGDNFRNDDDDLFGGLTLGISSQNNTNHEWLRGITAVPGVLYAAIRQTPPNPTVIRAFSVDDDGEWKRTPRFDILSGVDTDTGGLTHDSTFVFSTPSELKAGSLREGDPAEVLNVTAFRRAVDKISIYSWDPAQSIRNGAHSLVFIRGAMVTWTHTGLEIRTLVTSTAFPYSLAVTYPVGCLAPRSISAVSDAVYWLGSTHGGGLRCWRMGNEREIVEGRVSGDLVPNAIRGEAIEEMLSRIAELPNRALQLCIGWSDDLGGHPSYVLHSRLGGISMAYDAEADRWHTRSSKGGVPEGIEWAWLGDQKDQGAQRVTHSTTWGGRLVCGGFDQDGGGVVSFASVDDYRDIEGGNSHVRRIRQFRGLAHELRDVNPGPIRVDVSYNVIVTSGTASYRLLKSDNGGVDLDHVKEISFSSPDGPPPSISLMGTHVDPVYRVECESNAAFVLRGVYITDYPRESRWQKPHKSP